MTIVQLNNAAQQCGEDTRDQVAVDDEGLVEALLGVEGQVQREADEPRLQGHSQLDAQSRLVQDTRRGQSDTRSRRPLRGMYRFTRVSQIELNLIIQRFIVC